MVLGAALAILKFPLKKENIIESMKKDLPIERRYEYNSFRDSF